MIINMNIISINNIEGFNIGSAQDLQGGTGCTAIICKAGAVAGVDVRGGGPATRETELLKPQNMVEKIHCVMLSGGSAYGLSACDGAMTYLEEQGIGFNVGVGVVPIVCGASIFDLAFGDASSRPDKAMGYKACENSENQDILQGNVGAGTGATIGKLLGADYRMKGGLGSYAVEVDGVQCGAIMAVNAFGDIYEQGEQIAGIYKDNQLVSSVELMENFIRKDSSPFTSNTTIGCIITNAKLTKAQCSKLASVAHNGMAAAIKPVHTSGDGDAIFVMSTGQVEVNADVLGVIATKVVAAAIAQGVKSATNYKGVTCYEDIAK